MNLKRIIISVLVCIVLCIFCYGQTFAEDLVVGPDSEYQTIQAAIDQANSYDTILVSCGVYEESINLYKPLQVLGENGCTILENNGTDDIVKITADNCVLSGFTLVNCSNQSYSGLYISSDNNRIEHNTVSSNEGWGMYLYHAKNNTIVGNDFSFDGICIVGSQDDWESLIITNNSVSGKPLLFYKNMQNLRISNQTVGQLICANCSYCHIEQISVSSTDQGIVLGYSHNNTLSDNTVSDCLLGIRMQYAEDNIVQWNDLTRNQHGLYMTHATRNLIQDNVFLSNHPYASYFCCNSQKNVITKNKFINNTNAGYDYFDNQWSLEKVGNFYSDYKGEDQDADGIGDTPYPIPPDFGDQTDFYPIVDFDLIENKEPTGSPGFSFLLVFISIFLFISLVFKKIKNR